jgi:integrase
VPLLTQKIVDTLPSDRDGTTWDDDVKGLGLRVQAGNRTWIVRYRVSGTQRQKSLPGALPLRKAREQAAEIIAAARRGVDTVADGRAAARARRDAEDDKRRRSLGTIVESYLACAETELAPATLRELRRYLRVAWAPLHDCDAEALERRTIVARLEEIARGSGPVAANRAKSYLSMALSFGVLRGLLERNACIGIKAIRKEEARERLLADAELRAIWHVVAVGTDYGAIVRLLVLLGQRRDEVAGMRRSELDLDRALWRLPGERTKNGRPHDVPLPAQTVAILASRQPRPGRDLVFGERRGPFSGWSQAKSRLDAALALPAWTLHDIRRTVVTGMVEIGVAPHVVEAVVNHVSGHKGGVAGVYNRATYAAEKRAALQRWADHVERIVAGEPTDTVVAFGR